MIFELWITFFKMCGTKSDYCLKTNGQTDIMPIWSNLHVEDCHRQIFTRLFGVQWIIHLILTKTLFDEERVDRVVSHPQRLLEPIQIFLSLYTRLLLLLYKTLWLIHVKLHLQYSIKNNLFISILWISQSTATPKERMHLMVINLATWTKILWKFTWEYLRINFCY